MTIQEKAEALVAMRQKIAEIKEKTLIPLQAEKESLEKNLMDHLKRQGFDSVKTESATITIAHRKNLLVVDEDALVAELKEKGLNDYVKESLNKDLFKGIADNIKKTGEVMRGTQLSDTEYMSIRNNKKKINN